MLLHDQHQPLPLCDFFKHIEVIAIDGFADVLVLVAKNAGKNRKAVQPKDTLKFRKQVDDDIRGEIGQQQVNVATLNCIQGAAECVDIVLCIELDVCSRNLRCNRVNVASENLFCPQ